MAQAIEITCGQCGRALFTNGEPRFTCPYCGLEIETSEYVDETPEAHLRRLSREVERLKIREQIAVQSADDWFVGNPFSLFSGWDRISAREALDRGDFDTARRHLADGDVKQRIGCFLMFVLPLVVLSVVALTSLCREIWR